MIQQDVETRCAQELAEREEAQLREEELYRIEERAAEAREAAVAVAERERTTSLSRSDGAASVRKGPSLLYVVGNIVD